MENFIRVEEKPFRWSLCSDYLCRIKLVSWNFSDTGIWLTYLSCCSCSCAARIWSFSFATSIVLKWKKQQHKHTPSNCINVRWAPFVLLLRRRMRCAGNQEMDTYSALKPLTCNIRICLTIVLFPDSPAPVSEKKRHGGRGQYYVSAKGSFKLDRCAVDPAPLQPAVSPSTTGRDLNRPRVSPPHFPAEFLRATQKQQWTSKHMIKARWGWPFF